MDIVRSVGKNVKVKNFFYLPAADSEIDVSAAIRNTMVLFKVEYAGSWIKETGMAQLANGSVLVEDAISYKNNEMSVKITISFHDFDGNLTRLDTSKCKSLASNEIEEDTTSLARRLVRLNVLSLMRKIAEEDPGPWGILRGVRPTKIAHRLLDQNYSRNEIINKLINDYALNSAKAELITGIAIHQRPIIANPMNSISERKVGIYIGIPYCPSRCLYCSFPSYILPERREQLDAFLRAIRRDIESAAELIAKNSLIVENVYVGGGTPTSLAASDLAKLLDLIKESFGVTRTTEFTVEAGRPDSINNDKIDVLRQIGINRISINPQTMQDKTLKQIGRRHTVQDIIDIFGKIRHAGIPTINMDIIAGLPGETVRDLEDTMRQISLLNPENITIHTLALKRGSLLKESLNSIGLDLPNEETTKQMLAIGAEYTKDLNMHPYYLYRQKYMTGNLENVGYAKPGTDCIYNIQIMEERQTIIGIGPAAGTKAVNPKNWHLQSSYNAKDVTSYIKNLDIYLNERYDLLSRLYGNREEDKQC